jgi:hypothetical protein
MRLPDDVGKPIVGKPIVGARPLVATQGSISLCIVHHHQQDAGVNGTKQAQGPASYSWQLPHSKVRPKGDNLRGDFMSLGKSLRKLLSKQDVIYLLELVSLSTRGDKYAAR